MPSKAWETPRAFKDQEMSHWLCMVGKHRYSRRSCGGRQGYNLISLLQLALISDHHMVVISG